MDALNIRELKMYGHDDKAQYYSYSPKIVRSGEQVEIIIKGRDVSRTLKGRYFILVMPYYNYEYKAYEDWRQEYIKVDAVDNTIKFTYKFDSEQGYYFRISTYAANELYLLFSGMIYALDNDMYNLLPLKGDFHSHTIYSDGFESPESVLCAARRCGLDFLAVTDHNEYNGSVAAAEALQNMEIDMTIIHGEEYSSEFTNMHIISLGADKALDRRYISKGAESFISDDMQISCINSDKTAFACSQQLVDKIHENGGLAVMCHTFWKPLFDDGRRKDVPESLLLDLLRMNKFDGYEVVSGSPIIESVSSDMQMCFLNEAGLNYNDIAYLSVTDSHKYSSDTNCGKHYTVVFAEDKTEAAILDAVEKKQTVAVEIINGSIPKCYGALRYVKYVHFLIKYVFPDYDRIAFLQGESAFAKISAEVK